MPWWPLASLGDLGTEGSGFLDFHWSPVPQPNSYVRSVCAHGRTPGEGRVCHCISGGQWGFVVSVSEMKVEKEEGSKVDTSGPESGGPGGPDSGGPKSGGPVGPDCSGPKSGGAGGPDSSGPKSGGLGGPDSCSPRSGDPGGPNPSGLRGCYGATRFLCCYHNQEGCLCLSPHGCSACMGRFRVHSRDHLPCQLQWGGCQLCPCCLPSFWLHLGRLPGFLFGRSLAGLCCRPRPGLLV